MALSNEDPPQTFYLLSAGFVVAAIFLAWMAGAGTGLVGCVLLAFVIQWLAFVPSAITQDEKAFDVVGSATYLMVIGYSLSLGGGGPRQLLVTALVSIWAARLGIFLFWRVNRRGGDDRFEKIKRYPARFFNVWTLQGLWVVLTASGALIINAGTDASIPLGLLDYIGAAIWVVGFGVEVLSDYQKSRFNENPHNKGRFINTGFWATSRHPNYFGEILLWVGIFVIGMRAFDGWQWLAILSPVFVTLLLTRASGVPILEAKADRKWGSDPAYLRYKAKTSVLVPMPDPEDGAYIRDAAGHAEAH
jgi:steroid 5-alpha reductase family enzyme